MTTKTPAQLADEQEVIARYEWKLAHSLQHLKNLDAAVFDEEKWDDRETFQRSIDRHRESANWRITESTIILRALRNDSTPSGIFARHKEGADNFGCTIPLYTHPLPPPGVLEAALDAYGEATANYCMAAVTNDRREKAACDSARAAVLRLARGGVA